MKTNPPGILTPDEATIAEEHERVFEDRGELGRGGMGSVRKSWDPRILRHTALKVIDPSRAQPGLIPRFIQEAQITGQLEHPHIVPVHEFGVDAKGCLYMSLKLVDGETLWQRVKRLGSARLDRDNLGDLIQILVRVCEAMAYAHSRGVVHRDLKPTNVMCGSYGQVYVLDWGIAKLAEDGPDDAVRTTYPMSALDEEDTLIGTPSWMPPEQAVAEHEFVDHRSDVFALGALLYFILVGESPYGSKGVVRVIRKAQLGRFTPPSRVEGLPPFPLQLERIALRAMAYEPDDRYQSATEMVADLERFLRGTWSFPSRSFEAGQAVVRQGEAGDTAYVVRSGRLDVVIEEQGARRVVRELGPGDSFGEVAVFRSAPRSASVICRTDAELLVVTQDALNEGLGLNTWMGTFVTALAERFAEADKRLRQS